MAVIRRARLGDEHAVGALLVKLVKQHVEYDSERFSDFVTIEGAANFYRTRIEADEARIIVAEVDNEIAGFTYLEFEERDYEHLLEKAVWLHDIYIESEARAVGVGKGLM